MLPLIASLRLLGRRLLATWRRQQCEPSAFSPLATAMLSEAMPALVAPPEQWVRALAAEARLARQSLTSRFGEPPVTVVARGNLRIEVYFWLSPATALHDHVFSGAFGVAHGSSLQERYAFASDDPNHQPVRLGTLRRTAAELLSAGEVREIAGPDRCLHRVAHLEVPTVSVCVRTRHDVGAPAQYTYFVPGLAAQTDEHFSPEARRRIELVRMLMHTQGQAAEATAGSLVAAAPDLEAFYMLWRLFEAGVGVDRLFALLPDRPWALPLLPAFFERLQEIAAWTDPAGRRTLAEQRVAELTAASCYT